MIQFGAELRKIKYPLSVLYHEMFYWTINRPLKMLHAIANQWSGPSIVSKCFQNLYHVRCLNNGAYSKEDMKLGTESDTGLTEILEIA